MTDAGLASRCDAPMQRTRVNGVELAYFEVGSGPSLVMIHGWPHHSWCWRRLAARLSQDYRVIALDLRGCGDSETARSGFDKRTLAADVRALLDVLSVDRAIVVGHDWGVTTAFRLAFDYPDAVAAVIVSQGRLPLVASATTLMYGPQQAQERWYYYFNLVPELPEIVIGRSLREYFDYLCTRFSAGRKVHDETDMEELCRVLSRPHGLRGGLGFYRTGISVDVEDWREHSASQLRAPTLALWGACDPVVPLVYLDGIESYVPDLEVQVHPTGAHFLPEEEPDWFAERVRDFLARRIPCEHHVGESSIAQSKSNAE